ncbi:C_GCAxxG_C_C family probable redox protein [Hydrogenispora ethanolica]|uniref:C_GCAxxG_C_C family probable redox protein n=1 Tax=Hydrogenispora ethanolica TaxID=1082276 RepID=A0A4R1R8S6_HYDET|nr:C-GCAxxG-C-C family (seleno)protein [Hydrogenispora ethanolica]TCL61782.1 C_GCAxxG_C_C family probable redox protein [Hydrogenispora ethanolica]
MLSDLIREGFGKAEDLNCAEKILYGANEAYNLNLSPEALKLAAGFGGGMAIEDVCGALAGSIMVLGRMFVERNAHQSNIKELTQELFDRYRAAMGAIDCAPLKAAHRNEEIKCDRVIEKAAEILDALVERELHLRRTC